LCGWNLAQSTRGREATVRNVFAPIRIGATTQTQSFHGVIDDVWVSTNAVSKEEVIALSCIQRPFTLAVSGLHWRR
jgi:hypothetical protein